MNASPNRDLDIDLAKGLACLMMIYGHIGFQMSVVIDRPPHLVPSWIFAESSVALFFMATGMNVLHYVQRAASKKGFGPTRDFLITNVALFALGFVYNVNRYSVGLMDLFQGIAVAAFVTYIPFRRQWPTWAIVVIALEFFVIAFGFALAPDPSIGNGYIAVSARAFADSLRPGAAHPNLMGQYLAMLGELKDLPLWHRFLFIQFSALPWTGCAMLGGVLMRHARKKHEIWLWIFFTAILVSSLAFPFFLAQHMVDYFHRGKPDYVLRHVGIAGLFILAARRWYTGQWRAGRWLEFIGRESLFVFVLQWLFLEISTTIVKGPPSFVVIVAQTVVVMSLITLTTRKLAARRDRGVDSISFAKRWFAIAIGVGFAAWWIGRVPKPPLYLNVHLSHLISNISSVAFAMAFPSLKTLMRGEKKPKVAIEAAHA